MDAATGENNIQVKKMGAGLPKVGGGPAPVIPKDTKDSSKMTEMGKAAGGAEPPEKYAAANNGLKYTVKGGKETFNIELTP